MRWFIPSWNGDVRLVPHKRLLERCVLIVHQPTPAERTALKAFQKTCKEKKWWKGALGFSVTTSDKEIGFDLLAGVLDVGPALVRAMRGDNPATLTAIKFDTGDIETVAGTSIDLDAIARRLAKEAEEASTDKSATRAYREEKSAASPPSPMAPVATPPPPAPPPPASQPPAPEAAVSVKRPTPSCPQCVEGAIEPASEVLLTFLSAEQHALWAVSRQIVVTGRRSGHRYLLAHRHSARAQYQGRICFDLEYQKGIHFHDSTVPPEEEVLAAKLILEHREDWLRNEATTFYSTDAKYKNPFGDISDGVADANFSRGYGLTTLNQERAKLGLSFLADDLTCT